MKRFAKRLLPKGLAAEISFRRRLADLGRAYLKPLGWHRTIISGHSVTNDGPVPWITYPALKMLERVVRRDMRVFEYGAGNSSLWWAARVAEIIAVEHDAAWATDIARRAPANLTVMPRPEGSAGNPEGLSLAQRFLDSKPDLPLCGEAALDTASGVATIPFLGYAAEIAAHGTFDVVVVDGMARSLTAWMAAHHLRDGGFILFDNSDRWQFNAGFKALAELGFRRIDFWGLRPVMVDQACTSIFAKDLSWASANVEIPKSHRSDVGW